MQSSNNSEIMPRMGWVEAFSETKKKEQMLMPETIENDNFKWEW